MLSRNIETQLLIRSDRAIGRSRTGKTRKKPKCNPGNKVCGSRCIPVEWDCREKGQGYDNHLKAKQFDLLGGAANVERGIKRVQKGIFKGSPSEIYSGRAAIIRGVVKATPGTLAEKREREKALVRRSHLIAGGLAVVALGLTSHNILKSKWPGYREAYGDAIENSLRDGYSNFRDNLPGFRNRRLAERYQARGAVRAAAVRARYATITDPEFLKGRIATNSSTLAGNRMVNRDLNAVHKAIQQGNEQIISGTVPDFDSWNTRSRSSFLGAQRGGGSDRTVTTPPGSAFSDTATERYLSRQYSYVPPQARNPGANRGRGGRPLTALGNTAQRQSGLRQHMARTMRSQATALQNDATNRGYGINNRFLSFQERAVARESYLDRIMRENHAGMPDDVAAVTRENLRTLLNAKDGTTFNGLAEKQWRDTQQNFDNYYSELYTYSVTAPGASAPRPGHRNRIPASARDVLAHADVGHAATLSATYTPASPIRQTPVRGPSHAQLIKRDYYHKNIAGGERSTYNIQPNLAITAAQELTGRSDISRLEAYRVLREEYGFTNLNPPSPPRATRTRTPRRGDALPTHLRKSTARTDLRARNGKKGKKCGESYIPADHKCGPINGTSTKTKIGVAAALAGGVALAVAAKKYKVGEFHTGIAAHGLGQSDFVNPNFRARRQSYIAKKGKTVTNQELIDQVTKLKGTSGVIDANIDRHVAFLKKTGLTNNPNLADDGLKIATKKIEVDALRQVKVAQNVGTLHGFARFADDGQIYVRQTRRNLAKLDFEVEDLEKHMNAILEDMDTPAKPFFTGSYSPNGDIQEFLTTLHESGHKLHFKAGGGALPIKFADKLSKRNISYDDLEAALTKASTKYGMADIKGHYATTGNPHPRMETFAEMYTLYISSGKKFKAEHPLAYEWVDAIVDEAFEVQKW